jgi:hypothetical protein
MKNALTFRLAAPLVCLFVSTLAQAQTAPAGYWNTETNLTTRAYTIVRFYNGQDQLVYEETLPNLCLDFSRRPGQCRRTKSQLDATLQQVLRDPAAANHATGLLAAQFGQDRRVQRLYAAR